MDALILPSSMTTAFAHCAYGAGVPVDGEMVSYFETGRLLGPCNLIGLPALSVPAGLDDQGLPIGVQIVGPRWSESSILDVARALEDEEILPSFAAPPT